ncbi:MAG: BspA family leucine-rich repeat surface protein, partial [Flavobacteriaceae bacterium]|nr:BspA family leucine-rich repeat surface protein [Flavobacteriaceae bacterium]
IGNWDVSSVTDMRAMFYNAFAFNQNLSSWSVDGVTQCLQFSDDTTSWTLPQPNFTNCTP